MMSGMFSVATIYNLIASCFIALRLSTLYTEGQGGSGEALALALWLGANVLSAGWMILVYAGQGFSAQGRSTLTLSGLMTLTATITAVGGVVAVF